MTDIIISGAAGRVGCACSGARRGCPACELQPRRQARDPSIGRNAGTVAGIAESDVSIIDDLAAVPAATSS